MATLRVLDIVGGTSVDGPGLRTSIYLAGCGHNCPGCHNPQSWDFDGGTEMTVDEIMEIVREQDFNVTLSGGDPMYQPEGVAELAAAINKDGYTLWCYTGFTYEQLSAMPRYRELLPLIDVLVDCPFIEAERDLKLHFRGSSNQRLIDMRLSLSSGEMVLWSGN